MKKSLIISAILLSVPVALFAQLGFPPDPADPGAVPIVESIVALLGLGGAYAVKLWRKKKN